MLDFHFYKNNILTQQLYSKLQLLFTTLTVDNIQITASHQNKQKYKFKKLWQ